MKNPFESLNGLLKSKEPAERRIIRHPKETEIIEIAMNNLSQSEMGTELARHIHDNNIMMTVLRGRHSRNFTTSADTIYIAAPDNIDVDAPELTIMLVGAIRESAQEMDNMLRRVGVDNGESIYVHREGQKFEDKLFWQTGVVYELGQVAERTEFVDAFMIMGYGALLDAYAEDLES
jgi:hypothetical protein